MKGYDAIVVGAGPAGSTCAHRLASAGASVLVLDRARFPRDKPCGGGVTGRAARLLPFGVDPVVEDVVTSVRMRLRFGNWVERGDGEPLVLMTQRIRLDAYLLEQAGHQFDPQVVECFLSLAWPPPAAAVGERAPGGAGP